MGNAACQEHPSVCSSAMGDQVMPADLRPEPQGPAPTRGEAVVHLAVHPGAGILMFWCCRCGVGREAPCGAEFVKSLFGLQCVKQQNGRVNIVGAAPWWHGVCAGRSADAKVHVPIMSAATDIGLTELCPAAGPLRAKVVGGQSGKNLQDPSTLQLESKIWMSGRRGPCQPVPYLG